MHFSTASDLCRVLVEMLLAHATSFFRIFVWSLMRQAADWGAWWQFQTFPTCIHLTVLRNRLKSVCKSLIWRTLQTLQIGVHMSAFPLCYSPSILDAYHRKYWVLDGLEGCMEDALTIILGTYVWWFWEAMSSKNLDVVSQWCKRIFVRI